MNIRKIIGIVPAIIIIFSSFFVNTTCENLVQPIGETVSHKVPNTCCCESAETPKAKHDCCCDGDELCKSENDVVKLESLNFYEYKLELEISPFTIFSFLENYSRYMTANQPKACVSPTKNLSYNLDFIRPSINKRLCVWII